MRLRPTLGPFRLLYSPTLWRTTPIMRNGGDIANQIDAQACTLQGTNGGFPTSTGTIHIDVHLPHAVFHRFPGGSLSRPLCGKGGALPRPFESLIAGARPYHRITAHICNRHDGVVERRLDMGDTALDEFAFFFLSLLDTHAKFSLVFRSGRLPSGRPGWPFGLASNPGSTSFSGSGIRPGSLAANG